MKECGLNAAQYISGFWVGNSSSKLQDCLDPQKLHDSVYFDLERMPIDDVVIRTIHSDFVTISKTGNESLWTKTPSGFNGNCFTLNIPKDIRDRGISEVRILYNGTMAYKNLPRFHVRFDIFIHDHGLFLTDTPHGSSAGLRVEVPAYMTIPVEHQVINLLDYYGHECNDQDEYDMYECRDEFVYRVSFFKSETRI